MSLHVTIEKFVKEKKSFFLKRSFLILIPQTCKDFRWMQPFYGNSLGFSYTCLLSLLLLPILKSDQEHVEHGFSGKFKKEHGAEGDQHNVHADHEVVIGIYIHKFHRSSCVNRTCIDNISFVCKSLSHIFIVDEMILICGLIGLSFNSIKAHSKIYINTQIPFREFRSSM